MRAFGDDPAEAVTLDGNGDVLAAPNQLQGVEPHAPVLALRELEGSSTHRAEHQALPTRRASQR